MLTKSRPDLSELGGLTRAMRGFEQRLSEVEATVQACPAKVVPPPPHRP